jgi:translocation and assembly module TamB
LDELSFSREGSSSSSSSSSSDGPSVTLGKRFGRNFYAAYERSLSGAVGTFHIFYDITRWLTVRGEAGDRTAVDLIFTFTFD